MIGYPYLVNLVLSVLSSPVRWRRILLRRRWSEGGICGLLLNPECHTLVNTIHIPLKEEDSILSFMKVGRLATR